MKLKEDRKVQQKVMSYLCWCWAVRGAVFWGRPRIVLFSASDHSVKSAGWNFTFEYHQGDQVPPWVMAFCLLEVLCRFYTGWGHLYFLFKFMCTSKTAFPEVAVLKLALCTVNEAVEIISVQEVINIRGHPCGSRLVWLSFSSQDRLLYRVVSVDQW